jgi:lipoprotein-anchoring transpeptidase ErfK/SrfK
VTDERYDIVSDHCEFKQMAIGELIQNVIAAPAAALFALAPTVLLMAPAQAGPLPGATSGSRPINPTSTSAALDQLAVQTTPDLPSLGSPDRFLPDLKPVIRLVIKLADRRVYVYQNDQVKTSFPIAIGRSGWETPTGSYQVLQMLRNPSWQNPFTGEVIPAGSDNPLGTRWIGFWTDGNNFIGFHGTPNEETVGTPASHGCIRMYDRDVQKLFEMVGVGTKVSVVP